IAVSTGFPPRPPVGTAWTMLSEIASDSIWPLPRVPMGPVMLRATLSVPMVPSIQSRVRTRSRPSAAAAKGEGWGAAMPGGGAAWGGGGGEGGGLAGEHEVGTAEEQPIEHEAIPAPAVSDRPPGELPLRPAAGRHGQAEDRALLLVGADGQWPLHGHVRRFR